MQVAYKKIISRVFGGRGGRAFTSKSFADLGSPKAIERALSRLVKNGILERPSRGVYYFPKTHPDLGKLSPNPDTIARAIAGKFAIRLQPSGAYAANLLGLSTQVPAMVVYLTDGPSKLVRIGNQRIQLKHTTPKNMATAGRISGLLIQALRYLGRQHVDKSVIEHLRRSLKDEDKRKLLRDIRYAPGWIGEHIRTIAHES